MTAPKLDPVPLIRWLGTDLITVPLADLHAHPQNYREHPADQIEHLKVSIEVNGLYKPLVAAHWAGQYTLLVGHGCKLALLALGWTEAPVYPIAIDPMDPAALALLVGDNGIPHLAMDDDRALTNLLKTIRDMDTDALLGTGYDEMMLANLLMVTRPAGEIADKNEAAEWVGMPDYEPVADPLQAVISFRSEQDRAAFARLLDVQWQKVVGRTKTAWWPNRETDDTASVRFKG